MKPEIKFTVFFEKGLTKLLEKDPGHAPQLMAHVTESIALVMRFCQLCRLGSGWPDEAFRFDSIREGLFFALTGRAAPSPTYLKFADAAVDAKRVQFVARATPLGCVELTSVFHGSAKFQTILEITYRVSGSGISRTHVRCYEKPIPPRTQPE